MCMSKLIAKLKSSVLRGRIKDIPRVDDTLTKVGWAADASATGRNLATIQSELKETSRNLASAQAALNSLYDATGAQVEKLNALIDGYKIDSVTGVKEWLFPPMEKGVEYRTTERFMGKPVYAKYVKFGYDGDNTWEHGIEIDKIVDFGGYTDTSIVSAALPYYDKVNSIEINIWLSVSNTQVLLFVDGYSSGAMGAVMNNTYVWLKYTKTTD